MGQQNPAGLVQFLTWGIERLQAEAQDTNGGVRIF